MKEEFSQNGARDRPVLPDEEKIRLTKDRKIANRARAEAGIEDTAFRQAEKTITDTEEAISAQEARMALPEVYSVPEKAAAAAKEYQRLKDALSQAYADWEAAEEALAEAGEN